MNSSASLSVAVCLCFALSTGTALAQTVSGRVTYDGPAFQIRALQMRADPQCEKLYEEKIPVQDRLLSKDEDGETRGVGNVFVYLEDAPEGVTVTTPTEPVVLDQEGCLYTPRVIGIQVDQPLSIENDDPMVHNVRCLARRNRPFNIGQPSGTPPREKTFSRPEMAMKFKCDIHPWMSAYVFVMEHPFFAVTDEAGRFSIEGLPPGHYTLMAWHETFGESEVEVEVTDSGAEGVSFVYTEPGD